MFKNAILIYCQRHVFLKPQSQLAVLVWRSCVCHGFLPIAADQSVKNRVAVIASAT